MRLSNYVNIELGEGGGVYNKNCEYLNQSGKARVSCLQNFNVSQQVLSKIVAIIIKLKSAEN